VLAGFVLSSSAHAAQPVSPDSLGINIVSPSALSLASGNGARLARDQVDEGADVDPLVQQLAQAGMRLYPMLGLPCPPQADPNCSESTSWTPSAAAAEMAHFVTSFAQRYGPGGTFWSAHPELPYLPVTSYEIGNEPNIPLQWIQDETHLHWTDPSSYALVYAAARTALHAVDPTGVRAIVGGLSDSASGGVDISSDEQWLQALSQTPVDAIGYHPYVFMVSDSLLYTDTSALRGWLNRTGRATVPLDVNEFGACELTLQTVLGLAACPLSWPQHTSDQWGQVVAAYTRWALCTPSLGVENVQPFWWGANADANQDTWLPMVSSELTLTPYGKDFLATALSLTTSGCPGTPSSGATGSSPTAAPAPAAQSLPAGISIRVRRARRHARRISVTGAVRSGHLGHVASSGRVLIVLQRKSGRAWATVDNLVADLHHGHYSARLSLPAGAWRLWARWGSLRSVARVMSIV
jgi:hypothetical protein